MSDDLIDKITAENRRDEVVVAFAPQVVGDGYRFDPDQVLEEAKGQEFTTLAILAENPDGSVYIAGNANAGETLILMERAKRVICFGEDA